MISDDEVNATKNCGAVILPTWKHSLSKTNKAVDNTAANVYDLLEKSQLFRGGLAYDTFLCKLIWTRDINPSDNEFSRACSTHGISAGVYEDSAVVAIQHLASRIYDLKFNLANIREAVAYAAQRNKTHCVQTFLNGIEKWDGVDYISILANALRIQPLPSNLHLDVLKWFLISAVARIMRPGCKADHMLILEGGQGIGKSSAITALFGHDWTLQGLGSIGNKDTYLKTNGKWAVEVAELDSFRKREVTEIKEFLTTTNDTYRAPYERIAQDHPRQFVLIGTTNESAYLRDSTGARRFWPLRCQGEVDTIKIQSFRDKIWSHALHLYQTGGQWWPTAFASQALRENASQSYEEDPWHSTVESWLCNNKVRAVEIKTILISVLGLSIDKVAQKDSNRVKSILEKLGWKYRRLPPKRDGKRPRGYAAPDYRHGKETTYEPPLPQQVSLITAHR